jgi:hypothetical protein
MRTTDFCFPLPDYEYPCFVSYRHLFEAHASPLADGLAPTRCLRNRPRDRWTWRFTTPNPLRQAAPGWRAECSSDAPVRAVPLTPLSLPLLWLHAPRVEPSSRLPRPLPSPLREEETISTARGVFRRRGPRVAPQVSLALLQGDTPRACVDWCRSRSRSRDAFAMTRPLGAFSPSAPKAFACADALGYRELDPRPRPSPPRAVHAKRRLALLWIRLPPDDFCNLLPTHGHTPEHPILAFRRAPLSRGPRENVRSFSPCPFGARRPSPLEEGSRELRAATALPKPVQRRCKHAAE